MRVDIRRTATSGRGMRRARGLRVLALLTGAAVLGGCASFTPDGCFGAVERTTKERIGKDLQWARGEADLDVVANRVAELLARPPTVDDAVQVALLNNRGLQAGFQELGITEAEVVQAGRLPNLGFSFGRSSKGDEREIERGLHFNLARLVAMPLIDKMEARRFDQVKGRVSMSVLSLAAETRKAYFTALAAEETVRYMRQVNEAAEARAELARRMEQVGNFNKLQRAREQSFYASAVLQLARAEQAQRSSRERLVRLLGLWGAQTQFRLRRSRQQVHRGQGQAARWGAGPAPLQPYQPEVAGVRQPGEWRPGEIAGHGAPPAHGGRWSGSRAGHPAGSRSETICCRWASRRHRGRCLRR